LASILRAHSQTRGVVIDLPQVVDLGTHHIQEAGLSQRCDFIAGDFFQHVPEGGEAYILKWILHDRDDAHSIAILKNCREAMNSTGKLCVIEAAIPEGNRPCLHKFMDLNMLVMTGGRERTEAEYRTLFEAAGFRPTGLFRTSLELAVLEGVPVP
jgi:hypothetical protein